MKSLTQYIRESANTKERVVFRKDKETGEIVAFFPDQKNGSMIGSYSHNGQHSTASIGYYKTTKKATPSEYKELYYELIYIGYDLKVCQKITYKTEG